VFCATVCDTIHDWHAAQAGGFDHFFLAGRGALMPMDAGGRRDGRNPGFEHLACFAHLKPAVRWPAVPGGLYLLRQSVASRQAVDRIKRLAEENAKAEPQRSAHPPSETPTY